MEHLVQAPRNTQNFRCTFSLPQGLAKDISAIAKRLKLSQSALLALLLEEPIAQLAKLAALVPTYPSGPIDGGTIRQLKQTSVDQLRAAVREALDTAKAIDPGFDL